MRQRIIKYRRIAANVREDFSIGCRILTQPFFFDEPDWITVPSSWSPNIVTFKTYDATEGDGLRLWDAVQDRLARSEIQITPVVCYVLGVTILKEFVFSIMFAVAAVATAEYVASILNGALG